MRAALQQFLRGGRVPGLLLGLVAAVAVAVAAAPPDMSRSQAEQELEALRERMQSLRSRLEVERGERGELEARIESLDRDIAALAIEMRATRREQAAAEAGLARLAAREQALRERLSAVQQRLAELAYSAYVMGRQSHVKLLLNQQNPALINRMLGYHDYIVAARARTIGQINDWVVEIEALTTEAQTRQAELESLAATHRAEQDSLEARRQERHTALVALNERIAASRGELERLQENAERLQAVLAEIERYLAEQANRSPSAGAFRDMKGRLPTPVAAPISARFGEIRNTGVQWDGIMYRPPAGADVKAIFEGRVVFADWLRGFGLLLIIDHGGGFMSLYSHNQALLKQVGDWAGTAEVIATVGTSGGLDKPGLYFEIRNNGEPQNPLSWLHKG